MDWALAQVESRKEWRDSPPLDWHTEIARFYAAIAALDSRIAADGLGPVNVEKLFQSAIADAFTHTGHLAMLRRMAGIPVRGENYARADITAGRVGPEQTPPRSEFE